MESILMRSFLFGDTLTRVLRAAVGILILAIAGRVATNKTSVYAPPLYPWLGQSIAATRMTEARIPLGNNVRDSHIVPSLSDGPFFPPDPYPGPGGDRTYCNPFTKCPQGD
jgi:hypothetical protein